MLLCPDDIAGMQLVPSVDVFLIAAMLAEVVFCLSSLQISSNLCIWSARAGLVRLSSTVTK